MTRTSRFLACAPLSLAVAAAITITSADLNISQPGFQTAGTLIPGGTFLYTEDESQSSLLINGLDFVTSSSSAFQIFGNFWKWDITIQQTRAEAPYLLPDHFESVLITGSVQHIARHPVAPWQDPTGPQMLFSVDAISTRRGWSDTEAIGSTHPRVSHSGRTDGLDAYLRANAATGQKSDLGAWSLTATTWDVPEPSSAVMAFGGLLTLAILFRQQHRV